VNRQNPLKRILKVTRVNCRDSRAKKSISIDVNFRFLSLKKTSKKIKKKLASPCRISLNEGLRRQIGPEGRSKKL
jgi:hypothetical protein